MIESDSNYCHYKDGHLSNSVLRDQLSGDHITFCLADVYPSPKRSYSPVLIEMNLNSFERVINRQKCLIPRQVISNLGNPRKLSWRFSMACLNS